MNKSETNAIKEKSRGSYTHLHSAVRWGVESTVRKLLSDGIDVEARDGNGRTPLHWAVTCHEFVMWGTPGIVSALLEFGADINAMDNSGITPYQLAKSTKFKPRTTIELQQYNEILRLLESRLNKSQVKNTDLENRCLSALEESYRMYLIHSSRSKEKLIPLHGWVVEELRGLLGSEFNIIGFGRDQSTEYRLQGNFNLKNVDVAVIEGDFCIGVISIRFVCSNYLQNANNYFENLTGEISNLRIENRVFGHLLCLRHPIPYLTHDGQLKRYEYLRDQDIEKYMRLLDQGQQSSIVADAIGVVAVHAGETYGKSADDDKITRYCNNNDLALSKENFEILKNHLNINKFFVDFVTKLKLRRSEMKKSI